MRVDRQTHHTIYTLSWSKVKMMGQTNKQTQDQLLYAYLYGGGQSNNTKYWYSG